MEFKDLSNYYPHGFPSTAWSAILGAQKADDKERQQAMERLISIYWRPLNKVLQMQWNVTHEEAKDLTQEYLTQFIEKDLVDSVTKEKGRFRSYVKATLKHFMLNRFRDQKRQKRGGGKRIIGLDETDEASLKSSKKTDSPEHIFERELMCSILDQSLKDLKEHYQRKNMENYYNLFLTYYVNNDPSKKSIHYEDLEKRFSLNSHQVKNRLAELRVNFRKIILGYLRDGLSSDSDLMSEIKEVFSA